MTEHTRAAVEAEMTDDGIQWTQGRMAHWIKFLRGTCAECQANEAERLRLARMRSTYRRKTLRRGRR